MPSVILAGTTVGTSLSLTGDTSGELQIQTNNGATTAMTLTTAGNVGVGTSSPQGKFVASNSGANGFEVQPDAASGTETRINSYNRSSAAFTPIGINASQHYWLTSSVERMRIDSSGNVGIGTSSFVGTEKVNITFNSSVATTTQALNTKDTNAASSGTYHYVMRKSDDTYLGGLRRVGTDNAMGVDGNAYLSLQTTGTERMRIDSSGNVLINQLSAFTGGDSTLAVNGSIYSVLGNAGLAANSVQGYTIYNLYYGGSPAADRNRNIGFSGRWTFDVNNGFLSYNNTSSSSAAGSAVTSIERMRIDSSGNLLVGVTAQISSSKVGIVFDGATQNGIVLRLSANTSGAGFQYFTDNSGNLCGLISRVGTTSAVTYTTTSDYRLKTVIAPVADAGQRIDALQPIEYDWNIGGRAKGFLAHQFAEVYPNSVTGEKDAVDAEGKPAYQSMQASSTEVMADLIAEIQSLRKRVAQLESK
jgi:hypothetical protein